MDTREAVPDGLTLCANWYATRAHYVETGALGLYRSGRRGYALCTSVGNPVVAFDQACENDRTHTGNPKVVSDLPLCKKCEIKAAKRSAS